LIPEPRSYAVVAAHFFPVAPFRTCAFFLKLRILGLIHFFSSCAFWDLDISQVATLGTCKFFLCCNFYFYAFIFMPCLYTHFVIIFAPIIAHLKCCNIYYYLPRPIFLKIKSILETFYTLCRAATCGSRVAVLW
jgi:hypothetical protein